MDIKYRKWSKQDSRLLFESMRNVLKLKEPQFYFPIMSLFFYVHNTPNSHRVIDFKRKHYLQCIHKSTPIKDYNSNQIINAKIQDTLEACCETRDLFMKTIPLLDPVHYLLNNYNRSVHRNPLLPSNYSFNTSVKLNDMNNMAYIDVFFSFIVSHLTVTNKNPSFPIYYGSITSLGSYKHDISEDINELKNHEGFRKIMSHIQIDEYSSDSRSTSSSNSSNSSNSSCSSNSSNSSDYIATFQDFPIIQLFLEKLDGTLEDIIQDKMDIPLLKSCLFQITFALTYLQKHFYFTHNDLHINNVMFIKTKKPFLYYKFNNQYFKVPTYGYLFKIIDFGRSIFTFRKKTYMNDAFSKYGEAEGQYTHPPQVSFLKTDTSEIIYPSYHFDLCRLAITMIDEIRYNHDDDLEEDDTYKDFLDFLKYLVTDKDGVRLDKQEDSFDLYIRISRKAENSLPREILVHSFFYEYRIKKTNYPKSSGYTL